MPDRISVLRRLKRHTSLSSAEEEALAGAERGLIRLEPGTRFNEEGGACGFLVHGFTCRSRSAQSGRQILSLQVAGDFLGLQRIYLPTWNETIEALGIVDVLAFDCEALREALTSHAGLSKAIATELEMEASIVSEWLVNVGKRDATTRAAHLLAELGLRWEAAGLGARDRFEMQLTQEDLSDCIATTVHYTNKLLRTFERQGLIRRDRRRIHIIDWGELCRIGNFSEDFLHMAARRGC